jgi:hypothetical protein
MVRTRRKLLTADRLPAILDTVLSSCDGAYAACVAWHPAEYA